MLGIAFPAADFARAHFEEHSNYGIRRIKEFK